MANEIGQILYKVQDYYNANGGAILYTNTDNEVISVELNDNNLTGIIDIDGTRDGQGRIQEDIFNQISTYNEKNISINKLSIQAPPGTQFTVVTNGVQRDLMVGRTGIYELEYEDVTITGLVFNKTIKYVLHKSLTEASLTLGINGLQTASNNFIQQIEQIPFEETTQEYWDAYHKIYQDFVIAYTEARINYIRGINGIYCYPSLQDNIYNSYDELLNAMQELGPQEGDYEDLQNIIIDYIYNLV